MLRFTIALALSAQGTEAEKCTQAICTSAGTDWLTTSFKDVECSGTCTKETCCHPTSCASFYSVTGNSADANNDGCWYMAKVQTPPTSCTKGDPTGVCVVEDCCAVPANTKCQDFKTAKYGPSFTNANTKTIEGCGKYATYDDSQDATDCANAYAVGLLQATQALTCISKCCDAGTTCADVGSSYYTADQCGVYDNAWTFTDSDKAKKCADNTNVWTPAICMPGFCCSPKDTPDTPTKCTSAVCDGKDGYVWNDAYANTDCPSGGCDTKTCCAPTTCANFFTAAGNNADNNDGCWFMAKNDQGTCADAAKGCNPADCCSVGVKTTCSAFKTVKWGKTPQGNDIEGCGKYAKYDSSKDASECYNAYAIGLPDATEAQTCVSVCCENYPTCADVKGTDGTSAYYTESQCATYNNAWSYTADDGKKTCADNKEVWVPTLCMPGYCCSPKDAPSDEAKCSSVDAAQQSCSGKGEGFMWMGDKSCGSANKADCTAEKCCMKDNCVSWAAVGNTCTSSKKLSTSTDVCSGSETTKTNCSDAKCCVSDGNGASPTSIAAIAVITTAVCV